MFLILFTEKKYVPLEGVEPLGGVGHRDVCPRIGAFHQDAEPILEEWAGLGGGRLPRLGGGWGGGGSSAGGGADGGGDDEDGGDKTWW